MIDKVSLLAKTVGKDIKDMNDGLDKCVQKGQNGTYIDVIPLSQNAYNPSRLAYFDPSTKNRPPSAYGVLYGFSSKGDFAKRGENWITTLASGTDGRLYFCLSVNGGQDGWNEVITTNSRHAVACTNGIIAGQQLGTSLPFTKRWAKITDTTPPMRDGKSVNHHFNRQKIINVSYRIDGEGFSCCDGLSIEVHDGYFVIEATFLDANLGNRPVAFYVEYEP